jgi:outer membrane PBP1 activator LpoA protein
MDSRRPAGRGLLAAVLALALIVEAQAQPVQPPDFPATGMDDPVAMPGTGPFPEAPPAAPAGPRPIALILPLTGRQQALGRAVRDGFIAAHLAAGSPPEVSFLVLDEVRGAANAYRDALAAGAGLVVGPLIKESVQALAQFSPELPVLALNYLPDGSLAPPGFVQFGLAPEHETREVALRALALGQRRALALVPANPWGRRLLEAFTREFEAGGGVLVAASYYEPGTADYSQPIRTVLGAAGIRPPDPDAKPGQNTGFSPSPAPTADLLFLAANNASARQIRPQLVFFGAGSLPVYSTSAVYEDGRPDRDLNGIQFPDTPWTVAPDAQARHIRESLGRNGPAGALGVSRLYALGYDAYALAPRVREGRVGNLAVAGTTGQLSATWDGRILRRLAWAEIRGGALRVLPPVTAPLSDPAPDRIYTDPLPPLP